MDTTAPITGEQLAQVLPHALDVVDAAIESVKQANAERDAAIAARDEALAKLAAAKEDIELVKVASVNDDEIRNTVSDIVEAGFCPPELATKLATDFKSNPGKVAMATLRRISQLSIPPHSSGMGVRKNAFSQLRDDVADSDNPGGLTAEEVDAARRLRAELRAQHQ